MSRTNFNGPKDIRAIEVRLYIFITMEAEGDGWDPVKLAVQVFF